MYGIVYGVKMDQKLCWHVSIALEADAAWWWERGVTHLWMDETIRTRSFKQAVERQAQLRRSMIPDAPNVQGQWVECKQLKDAFSLRLTLYDRMKTALEGRCLLREELDSLLSYEVINLEDDVLKYVQWGVLEGDLRIWPGLEMAQVHAWCAYLWEHGRWGHGRTYRCARCGSGPKQHHWTMCPHCGEDCPYCEACLNMGRVRACAMLVQGIPRAKRSIAYKSKSLQQQRWSLRPAQEEAVHSVMQFLHHPTAQREFLLWAVTGAGKTEMMFPLIAHVVARGGRVLLATPRKDVVLELEPRLRAAFPQEEVVSLYGGSRDRWRIGPITVSTTHQLYRFREVFDLVIVDEIDAFPYHGDPQLAFAARRVCRPEGKFVFLTATPPQEMRTLAAWGRLPCVKVCVRFHGHPLPVPKRLKMPPIRKWLSAARMARLRPFGMFTFSSARSGTRHSIPVMLYDAVKQSLARGAQIFVFVPAIDAVQRVVDIFRDVFGSVEIEGTSSKDAMREEKVRRYRAASVQIIVTTTILERGVTIPRADVFVLEADSPLFHEAALIQMAGRAGRNEADPHGFVYFCASDWTTSQQKAVQHIQSMNQLAKKKGYLAS